MIFSELYGTYYNAVAKILTAAVERDVPLAQMREIIRSAAFEESVFEIEPAITSQRWNLISKDGKTDIERKPTMPLTNLQKRWLKAISLDKRIKLFDVKFDGLEDVQPLFRPEDIYVFDSFSDGDDYENEQYVKNFRVALDAVKNNYPIKIKYTDRRGFASFIAARPLRLEYSEKDDKFRLYISGSRGMSTINLGRAQSCERLAENVSFTEKKTAPVSKTVTIELVNERNALERVMLHFAHFEKQAERIDDTHYRLTITYDSDDENEMIIRFLSFGPFVKVVQPQRFAELIKDRLYRQLDCGL